MNATIVAAVDEHEYHAGEQLSSTGAKKLLDSPAKYRYWRTHPQPPRPEFDLGHVVHTGLLGVGDPIEVIDADSWRTNAAKEAADAAREQGRIPLLAKDADVAHAMIDAVQAHDLAAAILAVGKPEQSLYWDEDGVPWRGRIDWTHAKALVDVKTAASASPTEFGRAAANLRYDLQAYAYRRGYYLATGIDVPFLHICVEKEPPYLVAVHQLPPEADERGERLYREATRIFRNCTESGVWPGYPDSIIDTVWPRWAS